MSITCNVSANDMKASLNNIYGANSLLVRRSVLPDLTSFVYTIGYWGPAVRGQNMHQFGVINGSEHGVDIRTLQEGGFTNNHYNKSYIVTPAILSIWVNVNYNASFQLMSSLLGIASEVIHPSDTQTFINALATQLQIFLVGPRPTILLKKYRLPSPWREFQITYNNSLTPANIMALSLLRVVAVDVRYTGQVALTTYLSYNNYPLFYDNTHRSGLAGSGRYSCYRSQDNLDSWSYYTGNGNQGVAAQVNIFMLN